MNLTLVIIGSRPYGRAMKEHT